MRLKALVWLIFPALCACTSTRTAEVLFEAWRNDASLPLAHRIDETLTIEGAYRVQKEFAQRCLNGATPAGFKAGLTSAPSQARFKASGPIAGVLFAAGLKSSGSTLRLTEFRGLNIETEVAFRVSAPITERLHGIDEVRQHIDGIAPAIEFPDLDYVAIDDLKALDIVAANVGAGAYMLGEFRPPAERDPNAVNPRLVCNDKEVNRGTARDALGDQWQAVLWLINTMIDQGWTFERGQIVLTGALGRMIAAQPGYCVASFDDWGTIDVSIAQ